MFRKLLLLPAAAWAAISIVDPSDYADLSADASDNAIKAVYNITPVLYQTLDITGPYIFSGTTNDSTVSHTTLSVDANDTSVIVITEGADATLDHVTVIKEGYASNLYQSSFYGTNAAINVANLSTLTITHSNITVHNGAANLYAFGSNTTIYASDVDLYSSGPTSHGLYASGNGTIIAENVRHYSGGNRCSSFAGDSPVGYIYVTNAIARTAGIGSAIFYALGEVHGTNVVGIAEKSPVLFSDGPQLSDFTNVDLTSNFLAGTVMFSSAERQSGASLSFNSSRLTVTGTDQPALWFGNVIASAKISDTEISTTSGILILANASQVTQEFSYFAGYEENSSIEPALVTVDISESSLNGNVVAINGSQISWNLGNYSTWIGATSADNSTTYNTTTAVNVSLDKASQWNLTADSYVLELVDEDSTLSNIKGSYTLFYSGTAEANEWLDGQTYSLTGGGFVKPY